MRGTRLGSQSYEVDRGLPVERLLTTYVCPEGHSKTLPFASEADEVPDVWSCECGLVGTRLGSSVSQPAAIKHVKTHWDMLMERRTRKDLEELLSERVQLLRGTAKKSA